MDAVALKKEQHTTAGITRIKVDGTTPKRQLEWAYEKPKVRVSSIIIWLCLAATNYMEIA